MAWRCQDCHWGPAWTMRSVRRHGKATHHQIGGTTGPDWLKRWWWHRLMRVLRGQR